MTWLDISKEIERIKERGLYRKMRPYDSSQGPRVFSNGSSIINLSSNNYLGIAGSVELAEVAGNAIRDWGVGTSGSRLIGGTTRMHFDLEEEIASFKGEEASLAFNCGYMANVSTIPSLSGKEMTIYSDSLNHASIIDGCRLSKARVEIFKHGDLDELEKSIERYGNGMIVTDGVFSMTGEVAKLRKLRKIADDYNLLLYMDDAHGTGILGKSGRGTADYFNVKVDINMGTLSKAVGVQGGFVASSKERIDFLANTARGFIYSTAFPAAWAAAAIRGLELCKEEKRRKMLFHNVEYMREGLESLDLGQNMNGIPTPIIPVVLGGNNRVVKVSELMFKRGVFCHPIRYPTVPPNKEMLRITLMATHKEEDLDFALGALKEAIKEVGL
ncbi:MAG: aminotransferase class I/II-fold pyridoxal phosphate-dependent enzyme [Candidatus Thermoplasmatota archaeon]|nr:aminotransferase class I/II-fold pyridoxal phosphate-dependent enzyme [Candidatus Thermoplasmatota archaeon]